MKIPFTTVRAGLLAAACAASLGFGAVQAVATPSEAADVPLCSVNDPNSTVCSSECRRKGYSGGWCDPSYTTCTCYRVPPPIY